MKQKTKLFEEVFDGIPKKLMVIDILLVVAFSLCQSIFSQILSMMTSAADSIDFLKSSVIFLIIFLVCWELSEYCGDILSDSNKVKVCNYTRKLYLEKLYKTSPETLKDSNSGYIAGLLSKHIENVAAVMMDILVMGLISVVDISYAIVIFYTIHPALGITSGVMIFGGSALCIYTVVKVSERRATYHASVAELNKRFMDTINNISTVQKLRAIVFFRKQLQDSCDDSMKKFYHLYFLDDAFFCTFKLVMYMILPVNTLLCIKLKNSGAEFDMVFALTYIGVNAVRLVHSAKYIGRGYRTWNSYIVSKKQLEEMTYRYDIHYIEDTLDDFNKIELKDVSYQYGGNDIHINIPELLIVKGDFVALYGESGQGKTTTLNLLSGALKSGGLIVDNKVYDGSINPVYIAQDIEMFDMSLRDNLCLGNVVSDIELVQMLYEVGLGEWLEKQADGLDTIIGERGVKVSTGQRQRLNLIRGLLYDRLIYFLDEPTSNVDDVTEDRIINLIKRKLVGKTVIIVTHRPNIKKICNKHYEFKDNVLLRTK